MSNQQTMLCIGDNKTQSVRFCGIAGKRCNSGSCCASRKSGIFSMEPAGPAHSRAAPAEPIKAERSGSPAPAFIHGGDTKQQLGAESGASHTALRMVYSTSGSADRTKREQSTVVQMIGKYFSQMTTSSRRGSVESHDGRDSSGEDILSLFFFFFNLWDSKTSVLAGKYIE